MSGFAKSQQSFSADSPPFNPTRQVGTPPHGSARPYHTIDGSGSNHYSRSTSPYNSSYSGKNNPHSNAAEKYTFTYQGQQLEIRNVWSDNVEEEMAMVRSIVEEFPVVAMDTEFPGVVAKPVTETFSQDYHYKMLKVNVDLLKIIQLGVCFADEKGNFASTCWQFNFKFSLEDDMFAQDSIDLLTKSGISFEDHAVRGLDPLLFGELLMVSGLVLDDRVTWVSFHSGYDYGYLMKLLTTTDMPSDEKSFLELLKIYFPTIYDIKYMTAQLDGFSGGGLQKLADDLGCQRMGAEHQAGSDSLLTLATFFALKSRKLADPAKANELYGYGSNYTVRRGPHHREASTAGSTMSTNSE